MGAEAAEVTIVDLAFQVSGGPLPRDHSLVLWQALEAAAGWLAGEPAAAVLPIRAAAQGEGGLVLGRHSRLWMRLPDARVEAMLELCGRRLDLCGVALELGAAKTRPLSPHPTLYAHRVAAASDDEAAFVGQVARELAALGIGSEFIVGRRSRTRDIQGETTGFSLMLENLSPRESLALQAEGLGSGRHLGFGVFLGHK